MYFVITFFISGRTFNWKGFDPKEDLGYHPLIQRIIYPNHYTNDLNHCINDHNKSIHDHNDALIMLYVLREDSMTQIVSATNNFVRRTNIFPTVYKRSMYFMKSCVKYHYNFNELNYFLKFNESMKLLHLPIGHKIMTC